MKAIVVGSGDLARALSWLFHCLNAGGERHALTVCRNPRGREARKGSMTAKQTEKDDADVSGESPTPWHHSSVQVADTDAALREGADLVILALPVSAYEEFLDAHRDALISLSLSSNRETETETVMVDVSNEIGAHARLKDALARLRLPSPLRPVKAFCDLGAVDLLSMDPLSKRRSPTVVAGGHAGAVSVCTRYAEEVLGLSVKAAVSADAPAHLEQMQQTLGSEWIFSLWVNGVLNVLAFLYVALRYNYCKGRPWDQLPLKYLNMSVCFAALWGLALTLVPGTFVRLVRSVRPRSWRPGDTPTCLDLLLRSRKHVGLVAFVCLGVHVVLSLILLSLQQFDSFFVGEKGVWATEGSMPVVSLYGGLTLLTGTIGFVLYSVAAAASLPSVGGAMNRKQWAFVFGPLSWGALIAANAHVLFYGAAHGPGVLKSLASGKQTTCGVPSVYIAAPLLPSLVLLLKGLQVVVRVGAWVCGGLCGGGRGGKMRGQGNKNAGAAHRFEMKGVEEGREGERATLHSSGGTASVTLTV
uniref:Pyrroline-5-carboxylate reductase catalytic N-terminal domain-containing protein n=1 Tax=Chromera velia CCMP2878 TaxID=1169474 RepID=A0A0G4HH55_9ALVE|eukprot:Cvel_27424.t1-p1 / transcript=Cvel_27424.t1 / gene=Cvel_27424 / organism=Chromera_velia_CCMP2878 / gene_product=Metalloreductase STEAP4, putative / transcript_product=Metalloreductase STEAP4, putative / location=Cvel_scaffold3419:7594-9177(-) / protein_length=528 / sequence_SO=supercontig / SO=protein_coding / is_pseudo=false